MKRRAIGLLVAVVLLVTLSSCGQKADDVAEPTVSENAAVSAAVEGPDQTNAFSTPVVTAAGAEPETTQASEEATEMRNLAIAVGEQTFKAELANTDAADTFAAMLPLTLAMQELNGNEKYCYMETQFSTEASIPDMIYAGDIMLYGDDCVVLFYADHTTTYSYTPIGHIVDVDGLSIALGTGDVEVRFS